MSRSDLEPRDSRKPEIIDAEFEEVRDDDDKASFNDVIAWLRDDAGKAAKNLLMIVGGVTLLLIILSFANPNTDEAGSPEDGNLTAEEMEAQALAMEANADALDVDVDATTQPTDPFLAQSTDVTTYSIAEAGTACGSEPVRQLLSSAMHDYMTKFLVTRKPAYLSGINTMMPPIRPAIAEQFLANASMDWQRIPVQTTWDILGDEMHLQCEGQLTLEIPAFKDDGSAAVFTFSPLEWAIIFPTDLSGDPSVVIHDRPEEYGRKIFLETAGQTLSLTKINSLLQ